MSMKKTVCLFSALGLLLAVSFGADAQERRSQEVARQYYSDSRYQPEVAQEDTTAVERPHNFSVSTNAFQWLNLATLNAEAGLAVSRHFTLHAGVRYNPWTFIPGKPDDRLTDTTGETERQFENRKQAYNLGVRFWPWYAYSGWWISARAQYMEYNFGGIFRHWAEEGDAFGAGLGVGYTYLLHKHWNIEFGAGLWAGYKDYVRYRCTNCGSVTGEGGKGFLSPDEVFISLVYVF